MYSEVQQLLQKAQSQNALAPANHPETIRLRNIAKKIIPYATRWNPEAARWKWEVNLLGGKQINAFVMPGGKIAVYTGLLNERGGYEADVTVTRTVMRGGAVLFTGFANTQDRVNVQGLWWKDASESGWGVNLTQQGDVLFATWFTYDEQGQGMWLVMSNGERTGTSTSRGS